MSSWGSRSCGKAGHYSGAVHKSHVRGKDPLCDRADRSQLIPAECRDDPPPNGESPIGSLARDDPHWTFPSWIDLKDCCSVMISRGMSEPTFCLDVACAIGQYDPSISSRLSSNQEWIVERDDPWIHPLPSRTLSGTPTAICAVDHVEGILTSGSVTFHTFSTNIPDLSTGYPQVFRTHGMVFFPRQVTMATALLPTLSRLPHDNRGVEDSFLPIKFTA